MDQPMKERRREPLESVDEVRMELLLDKGGWLHGPWMEEPDRVEWRDKATGLPCLLVRHPVMGHWCGYVAVEPGHPWHSVDFAGCYDQTIAHPEVHGGVTYARGCEDRVCHVPMDGESHDAWWLGFDAAHAFDATGFAHPEPLRSMVSSLLHGDYRDVRYMMRECRELARQAVEALRQSYAPARTPPDASKD